MVPVVWDRVILLKNHEPLRSSSSVLHPFILMFPMTIFSWTSGAEEFPLQTMSSMQDTSSILRREHGGNWQAWPLSHHKNHLKSFTGIMSWIVLLPLDWHFFECSATYRSYFLQFDMLSRCPLDRSSQNGKGLDISSPQSCSKRFGRPATEGGHGQRGSKGAFREGVSLPGRHKSQGDQNKKMIKF